MGPIIDAHVHPANEKHIEQGGKPLQHAAEYFGHDNEPEPIEETVQKFLDWGIDRAILFALDSETFTDTPRVSNEWVAEMCDEYDLFRGFASVDPHKGKIAVREAKEAIHSLELDGFKFQQATQGFRPDRPEFEPLWDTLEELGKPVLFHGGMTGIGAGAPGGDGIVLDNTRPVYVDRIAAKHPEMEIIIAHPAWPWHQEQLAIVQHKANVYMDLSGWRPKYIPDEVKRYARTMLSDKVMFGSDYPLLDPKTWLDDFQEWDISDELREKILYKNASDLFDISV